MFKGLLSIDPGLTRMGYARWSDYSDIKTLCDAGAINTATRKEWIQRGFSAVLKMQKSVPPTKVGVLVIEMPEYQSGRMESEAATRSGSIMKLAALVGMILHGYETVQKRVLVTPAQWKGQLPKEVSHQRIADLLELTNRRWINDWKHMKHDTRDAIGIGLHAISELVKGKK